MLRLHMPNPRSLKMNPQSPGDKCDTYDFSHAQVDFDPPPKPGPAHPTTLAKRLHTTTYEYLRPTDEQMELMRVLRLAAKSYSDALESFLPDGPDKTFILRAHRQNAMWVNVAVTRLADGTPRP